MNARRIDSRVPKPHAEAIESTPSTDSSRRRRAASTRKFSLEVAERFAIRNLRAQLDGKLRLPAGAAQEHHEFARHRESDVAAVVFFQES